MSILYDHSFNYPEGELNKNHDHMNPYVHHQQQTQRHDSGSARYRSSPSSSLENLINGGGNSGGSKGGLGGDDYHFIQSSSLELENLLAKYRSSCGGLYDLGEEDMKQEEEEFISQKNGYHSGSATMYGDFSFQNWANGNSPMDISFGAMNNIGLENTMQVKTDSPDGSNLARQNSSPAGFFNLGTENGFDAMRDLESFRNSHTIKGEASSSVSGLNGHMNLSYGPSSSNSRTMSRIAGTGPESMSNFSNDSWNKTSFSVFKGSGENNIAFASLNTPETHNENCKNRLTHHLSLPATFSKRATKENYLHFQETVPCKIRAKRGCATHPRSIAERVRRTRISERMRKLQDLVPNMDKQTSTAEMLDLAVAHIKELQKQVKALMDTRAKCTCVGNGKQIANCSS